MIPFLNPEHNPYESIPVRCATLDTSPPWHLCTGAECPTCAEYPAKLKHILGHTTYDARTQPSRLAMFRDGRGEQAPHWPTKLLPSTTAIIVHGAHWEEGPPWTVLIHQRADNGWWGFPGGAMEIGESLEQCVRREVLEETGLHVHPMAITSIDSDPTQGALCVYPDGNVVQYINHTFLCKVIGGVAGVGSQRMSGESVSLVWRDSHDLPDPFLHTHFWRLQQAFAWLKAGQVSVR